MPWPGTCACLSSWVWVCAYGEAACLCTQQTAKTLRRGGEIEKLNWLAKILWGNVDRMKGIYRLYGAVKRH